MTKEAIRDSLIQRHQAFVRLIFSLNDNDFMFAPPGKWTAGQQLDHIIRSVSPVSMAFVLPKSFFRLLFGKANRQSRSYEALVEKYLIKLGEGGRAFGRFIPSTITLDKKQKLHDKLLRTVKRLASNVDRCTEEQLDHYILPHPLLGKVTLREMLYFTMYHVEHHHKLTLKNLRR